MRYYIDACIWIDYYENRQDRFRPLGEWALRLLQKIVEEDSLVFYSFMVIDELSRMGYSPQKIRDVFKIIKFINLIQVHISDKQIKESKRIAKKRNLPRGDALHAIVARDQKVVLITRDKHFNDLTEITQSYNPEDLI